MFKEPYFTKRTLRKKSQELLDYVDESRRRHANLAFRIQKAALLVLDMQAYFLDENSHAFIPSAPAIVSSINEIIATFESMKRPVFFTQHLNTSNDAGMMALWWRDMITSQSAYSHVITSLKIHNLIQITKTQYDAFYHTELESNLEEFDVSQVVICGVMTHLCCETTARSAFMRGFEVFFTIDGTATYNEELHRATLLTLSHGFAVPVLASEILQSSRSDGD